MAVASPKPKKSPLANAAGGGIQAQAQAQIDPIIAAITNAANQRAAASEAAIKGLTDSYAHELGAVDLGSPYAGAESGQAAVDAALRQALAGGGADLASQLAARLSALEGSSGEGAVQQAGQALASQGASAGTTRLASGSAALSQLLANAANASAYSKKLPGLARLFGLQGVKQAEGNAQQEIAKGTLQEESQLPSIVNSLRSAKAEAAYRNAELGLASQRNQISAARAKASIAQGYARLQQGQERLGLTAAHYRQLDRHFQAQYGLSLARLQLAQQKAVQSHRSGGLTPGEYATMRQKAAAALQDYYHGVAAKYQIGADGNRVLVSGTGPGSAKTYKQAIKSLVLSYPQLGPKQIIGMANKLYKPGEGGRPFGKQPNLSLILGRPGGVSPPPFVGGASLDAIKNPAERAQARTLIGLAQDYIGTPYVWGGESPKGFDCSGFAQFLYAKAGVKIPRTTYTQWQAGHAVPPGQLMPGDLVFFKGSDSIGGLPGHVGLYIGGGKMIDAPHTGATVRIENIGTFGGYMGARRYGRG